MSVDDPWEDVGEIARSMHRRAANTVERFRVARGGDPLTLEPLDGGDPVDSDEDELSLTDGLRRRLASRPLDVGDVVVGLRDGDGWLLTDAETDADPDGEIDREQVEEIITEALDEVPDRRAVIAGPPTDGSMWSITAAQHGLGASRDLTIVVRRLSDGARVVVDDRVSSAGAITLIFPTTMGANACRAIIDR